VGRDRAADLVEHYRRVRRARGAPVAPGDLLVAIETDRTLRVPAMRLAGRQAGRAPTYAYRFDLAAADRDRGACHGIDVAFVFGNRDTPPGRWVGWTPAAEDLARLMSSLWLAWIRGDRPAGWPPYRAGTRPTMIFAERCRVQDAPDEPERQVWRDEEIRA
jgi:para-nitrobenzyl esterase